MKEQMTKKLCVNKYVKKSTNSKMMSLCHDDNDNEDDSGDDNHDDDDNALTFPDRSVSRPLN